MLLNILNQWWFIAAVAICIALGFGLALARSSSNTKAHVSGLQRKSRLFSVSERKFFESLSDALDYDFHIFAKVGVLELLERGPKMSKGRYKRLVSELKNERFDYVVCKKSDLSVSAIIELECFDRRISRSKKQNRTALISELCKATKLRLFYFDTRQDYLGVDIRRLITGSSKCAKPQPKEHTSKPAQQATQQASELTTSHSLLTEHLSQNNCPKCHSELVTKVAMKGDYIGERFLMCRKYPYCDHRVLIDDPNVVNIRSVSVQKSEIRKGFSDWAG